MKHEHHFKGYGSFLIAGFIMLIGGAITKETILMILGIMFVVIAFIFMESKK